MKLVHTNWAIFGACKSEGRCFSQPSIKFDLDNLRVLKLGRLVACLMCSTKYANLETQ